MQKKTLRFNEHRIKQGVSEKTKLVHEDGLVDCLMAGCEREAEENLSENTPIIERLFESKRNSLENVIENLMVKEADDCQVIDDDSSSDDADFVKIPTSEYV